MLPNPDHNPTNPLSFLSERKAADILGVSVKSLRRWRYQRSGPPYVKLRHLIRYSVQDLQNWMAGQKVSHQQ